MSTTAAGAELSLVPLPAQVTLTGGWLELTPATTLDVDEPSAAVAEQARAWLGRATGLRLPASGVSANGRGSDSDSDTGPLVRLRTDPSAPAEGYRVSVTATDVTVVGGGRAGLLHGLQTLRQLLPHEALATGPQSGVAWRLPCVEIVDAPALPWRGAMVDVARHFMPKEFLLRLIDVLALHRMTTLHLHLTDDQGWRVEVPRYPRLTEVGAWREQTMAGHAMESRPGGARFTTEPHGGFYSRADLQEIVRHATFNGIDVVPEIDLPGHTQAAIAAYPELGNVDAPLPVSGAWGVHEHVLNVDDATVEFFRNVLHEVLDVFPGRYVHLGGDECPTTEWAASPTARARMRQLGTDDPQHLQGWFTRQVATVLQDRGRRLVGWDELLESDPPADALIMAWRSEAAGVRAVRAGHQVVMTPQQTVYLDHYQGAEATEPLGFGGLSTLRDVFGFDPFPAGLTAAERERIVGAQCQLWTEYVPTPEHAEYMLFPRLCAFAERVWGGDSAYPPFLSRLAGHLERLDTLGLGYRPVG